MNPRWPYSFITPLPAGAISWTTPFDAGRLPLGQDATEIHATQIRELVN
ncbi:hypothetical protein ACT3UA_12945 [Glutamicibacter sp. 363]